MGRWMEVLCTRPSEDEDYLATRPEIIVDEFAPYNLIYVARYLGREGRRVFPMLNHVYFLSDAYIDESLWLNAQECESVLDELRTLRRVCHYEQFVSGLDGRLLRERWRGDYMTPTEFEISLDHLERAFEVASKNQYWIRIML